MTAGASPAGPRRLGAGIHEWAWPAAASLAAGLTRPRALRCSGPDGQILSLSAFADGDHWRVRLAAPTPGVWRISTAEGATVADLTVAAADAARPADRPRVSADGRHLVDGAGQPAFFFADTAWSIVWKGTPEQWERYLDRRAEQGFTVLQVTLLPWRWHLTDVEGNRPFIDGDPARPNAAYFRRFDQFIARAAARGLTVCLMLIWGGPRQNLPAVNFTTPQAVAFAEYAVARFGAWPTIWSLSGDAEYVQELDKWEAVGAAVAAADPYARPTTNHLPPSMNWHALHHESPWFDFHMLQTGHRRSSLADIAALPFAYYRRTPVKPVVNGEPWYEAHPSRDTPEYGPVFTPRETRHAFWTSLLSGATMGHTYGSQGIWNWKRPDDDETEMAGPQIGPPWFEALEHAGAVHCALGVRRLRALPWWRLSPVPERIESVGAAGPAPACATVPGALWLAYLPAGGAAILKGVEAAAWEAAWFDPRTAEERPIGPARPALDRKWTSPAAPTDEDWVLILTASR